MRRGTTPTHTFNSDIDLTGADAVYVTYKQGDTFIAEHTLDNGVEITADTVSVTLTQAETLLLDATKIDDLGRTVNVSAQIRAAFPDGTRIASNIIHIRVEDILKDGEI